MHMHQLCLCVILESGTHTHVIKHTHIVQNSLHRNHIRNFSIFYARGECGILILASCLEYTDDNSELKGVCSISKELVYVLLLAHIHYVVLPGIPQSPEVPEYCLFWWIFISEVTRKSMT